MRERETPKQRLAYRAYATVEWLARTLPEPVARRVFRWFGRLTHRGLHGVRATVEDNMAHVLGRALHRIVMVRLRWRHEPTIEYLARRTAEGKSKREIVRCLKRYVAREVYRTLVDGRVPPLPGS